MSPILKDPHDNTQKKICHSKFVASDKVSLRLSLSCPSVQDNEKERRKVLCFSRLRRDLPSLLQTPGKPNWELSAKHRFLN